MKSNCLIKLQTTATENIVFGIDLRDEFQAFFSGIYLMKLKLFLFEKSLVYVRGWGAEIDNYLHF